MSSTFERVSTWNTLCGKDAPEVRTKEYYKALRNQAQRIKEELEELNEAIDNSEALENSKTGDRVWLIKDGKRYEEFNSLELRDYWNQEILDAGCDLDVVVSGANFLAGHDYESAINEVLDNNDVKFTCDLDFAEESLKALGEDTHEIVAVQFDGVDEESQISIPLLAFSVHRKADDKICKLLNHPRVNLSPFVNK